MKKLILLILVTSALSCSSDDSNTKQMPEKFDIRVEIIGTSTVPKVIVNTNSFVQKEWEYQDLPFTGEYTYLTEKREAKSITISTWVYLSKNNEMTEYNLYVDGKLVDSTTITLNPYSDGLIKPAILKFIYKP